MPRMVDWKNQWNVSRYIPISLHSLFLGAVIYSSRSRSPWMCFWLLIYEVNIFHKKSQNYSVKSHVWKGCFSIAVLLITAKRQNYWCGSEATDMFTCTVISKNPLLVNVANILYKNHNDPAEPFLPHFFRLDFLGPSYKTHRSPQIFPQNCLYYLASLLVIYDVHKTEWNVTTDRL